MLASLFTKYGSPDYLELKEVWQPVPKDNEVLIKIHAASINSWDWELLNADLVNRLMFGLFRPTKIQSLGCDIAGQLVGVGKDVKHLQLDDEVFGDLSHCGWGGFAEYVCAPESALNIKPASLSFEQAAALPQAGLLAFQGLVTKGQIQSGQKVLINGAGGGSGSFAIQIANAYGAEVTAVDSTEKLESMRLLGADHVIDYTQEDFTKNGQTYDLIVDMMARHPLSDYKRAINSQGQYVMAGGDMSLVYKLMLMRPWLKLTGGKEMSLLLHKANESMQDLLKLIADGKVTPVIDRSYPLSEVADALCYFGEGHTKGKVIITI